MLMSWLAGGRSWSMVVVIDHVICPLIIIIAIGQLIILFNGHKLLQAKRLGHVMVMLGWPKSL